MHHLYFRFICSAVLVLIVSACSSSSPSAPSPAAVSSASAYVTAQLDGTWTVSSIHPIGQSPQQRPAGATYSLSFGADGRLSTRVDCNVCGGPFSVNGATLTAGPNLACTRALCPTASFETAYTSLLSGDSVTAITANTLTLSSTRGAIQLVR